MKEALDLAVYIISNILDDIQILYILGDGLDVVKVALKAAMTSPPTINPLLLPL
jgi:hypothetical protein